MGRTVGRTRGCWWSGLVLGWCCLAWASPVGAQTEETIIGTLGDSPVHSFNPDTVHADTLDVSSVSPAGYDFDLVVGDTIHIVLTAPAGKLVQVDLSGTGSYSSRSLRARYDETTGPGAPILWSDPTAGFSGGTLEGVSLANTTALVSNGAEPFLSANNPFSASVHTFRSVTLTGLVGAPAEFDAGGVTDFFFGFVGGPDLTDAGQTISLIDDPDAPAVVPLPGAVWAGLPLLGWLGWKGRVRLG